MSAVEEVRASRPIAERLGVNAERVVAKRYSRKTEAGEALETWEDVSRRVVAHVAEAERDPDVRGVFASGALALLLDRRFIPNTPCLVNAGKPDGMLAACFVLDVPDSIDGILKAVHAAGTVHQQGGGTGFTFEKLRPAGSVVRSTHGVASGPVSFMNIFNTMTETVKQGGVRRGANMAMLSALHPDVLRFIHAKNDQSSLTNFNISVTIPDAFMRAVERAEWFELVFDGQPWGKPVFDPTANDGKGGDYLYDGQQPPRPGMLFAPDVWRRIVESAWKYAEPGIAYIDEVNRHNHMTSSLGPICASNPCVTGDTSVATPEGPRRADSICVGERVTTVTGSGVVERVEVYPARPVFRVLFSDGTEIKATAAHQFHLATGDAEAPEWVPTRLDALAIGSPVRALGDGILRVEAIAPAGVATVYDLFEPETDTWITEGVVSRGCGEQFLHSANACNLGSIDVAKYYDSSRGVDWTRLADDVTVCVRFLDGVIDTCAWPLPAIAEMVGRTRPIGLGVMGIADLLLMHGIRYGTEEAADFTGRVMAFVRREAWRASCALGREKGAFAEYRANADAYDAFLAGIGVEPDPPHAAAVGGQDYAPRNYEVTTVAPTGTISLVAETSSGIEPNFSWAYVRRDTLGERVYVHSLAARALGIEVDQTDPESIRAAATYVVDHESELPLHFVTAHQVSADEHLRMLAAAARNVDNSVSKTVNGSADDTVEDVDRLYRRAYHLGVKAVSYYRDGSRAGQVLTAIQKPAAESPRPTAPPSPMTQVERPKRLSGETWRVEFDSKRLYVTVNHDGRRVVEVFVRGPLSESIGMLASKMLRSGFEVAEVARMLNKIIGTHSVWFNERLCTSPEQAVAECLLATERQLKGLPASARQAASISSAARGRVCGKCGATTLERQGGCDVCTTCYDSKCS
jgi:ribonucleoside-diphosphate reductase alpha chain